MNICKYNEIDFSAYLGILMGKTKVNIHWFRRDLRLNDNVGLSASLGSGLPVLPLFILDRNILDRLDDKKDARISYIHHSLLSLDEDLRRLGSRLIVRFGHPEKELGKLFDEYMVESIFTNEDYEPYAKDRDETVNKLCRSRGVEFNTFKDQVIFSSSEILKSDATPYHVFTPYSKRWLERLKSVDLESETRIHGGFLQIEDDSPLISLKEIGFEATGVDLPMPIIPEPDFLNQYASSRNTPSISTSRVGVHLRFGTLSVRELVRQSLKHSPVFLNELIWREFFMQILAHYPRLVDESFRKQYDRITWRNEPNEFASWCEGRTGYPLVDAGMRELNATGFMHNRVRMVVASFLCKHLLIDWRWGETYFASKLLDYELSSNNGNWQWAAGTGCDAAPYFRVFNPTEQARKFDSNGEYIRRWVPEIDSLDYPQPMVEHRYARERALKAYRDAIP